MPEQPEWHLQERKLSDLSVSYKKADKKRENLRDSRVSLSFFRQICRNRGFFER